MTVALATMIGISAATFTPAEAGGRDVAIGIGAGIIGFGILGGYAHARDREHYYARDTYSQDDYRRCYRGAERCGWSERHCFINSYGDEVCRGGRYTCYRPTVCD